MKIILFLIVKFIYNITKITFQKKESHAEGVLQILKKFAPGVWRNTNKQGKRYPFPVLVVDAESYLYTIFCYF